MRRQRGNIKKDLLGIRWRKRDYIFEAGHIEVLDGRSVEWGFYTEVVLSLVELNGCGSGDCRTDCLAES